ncbi:MAG TPA: DUF1549 and DUF1553 domain-containing protein [Verrucomicrobiae bacterium]|nr:DUF1549 and DUF1553 domain-containing protein [Verrucomicrobiae bacterium]
MKSPIDAFILAQLEQHQMSPSPPAARYSLLRRVTFDLTGLPPTPEEAQRFLNDPSPDAYERLVDRLLASPRYGERWARHWMDAVHFAETHGHDQDRIRTNAWPYRDYLIGSFNQDKPYARFIEEQLAGDVLFANDPQATVALGFIAAGPWDESSLRDIREDTLDRQIARYLDRDDMVATTMSTFVSTTAHCARCHDHKFDPFPQQDYYSLQAVFAGVDRAERVFDPDPRAHARRQELLKRKRAADRRDPELMASLLTPAVQTELFSTLASLGQETIDWIPLTSASATSSNGTVLTAQSDGSFLASGPRPEKDVYVVTAPVARPGITGVRLEVLPDDSLPHHGPGRQDNGNLHLNEFKVFIQPQTSTGDTSSWTRMSLQHPSADFNQDGWTVRHAIDEKIQTAWGIYPQVGQKHMAVFEVAPPSAGSAVSNQTAAPTSRASSASDLSTLRFDLEQAHGGGHLIGRFRLSVTYSQPPIRVSLVPEALAAILRVPAGERTPDQQRELAWHALKIHLEKQLAALGPPHLIYAGASDFIPDGSLVPVKAPRAVHLLKRGDINRPEDEAHPGAWSAVSALPSRFQIPDGADEGHRRAALAQWISDARNPLTWRSIVNRVWQHHFGAGLVETINDFGRMGGHPSHPELLDWLAGWFQEHDGSFKALHRLILNSAVYQQSSVARADYARQDADDRLLWRMNRSRLDAESVHDALLQITARLDLTMGGPSDRQFALSPGIHVTPVVDYGKFDVDSPEGRRRSVYRFLFRTLPDPFMDSLDCPEGSQLAPTRGASVTALQALSMLNNPFVVRQSQHLAERVAQQSNSLPEQIRAACELVLGRTPTSAEKDEFLAYARQHGLANLCHLFFNSNEFIFVE